MKFRNKQKVFLVRMDLHGSYDVVAGTVTRAAADPSGTVMVRIPITTREGEPDTLVVDARPANVYPCEADALAAALEASLAGAGRWMERAAELAKRLATARAGRKQN
jgi:hypothetical protein